MKNKLFINLFLGFVKLTGFIPALIFLKPRIYKEDGASRQLPKPCMVVSNHKSLIDFVLLLFVFPFRTIRFLMAEVLYNKSKIFAFFLDSIGGMRVDRDGKDFSFISNTLEVLDNKGTVGIFPQARLPIPGKQWPFTTSTAFISMHADAPIVPVYTDGNYGLFKRASVCVGKPFYLSDYRKDGLDENAQMEHLTKVLEQKVMDLKKIIDAKKKKHNLFNFKLIPMDMARFICIPLIAIFRVKRLTTDGKKYKQKIKGSAVIAANHTSFSDIFTVGLTFWYRRLYFLAAEVVMKTKLRSFLLKGVGAIRIDRNAADIEAINKSIDKLKNGFLLAVFPQGGIHKDDDINDIKSGAVLMAIRSNSPIVPMHILPKKKWYSRKQVVIGKTIYPSDYCKSKFPSTQDINNISLALIEELNKCKNINLKTE